MLIPDNFAQINWQFSGPSCPHGAETTLGVDVTTFPSTPSALAELASTLWVENFIPQQSVNCVLTNVLVKFGPNDTGPSGEFASNEAGDVSGESDPANTAFLIRKTTATGGRTGRGRMYVPGVPSGLVNSGGFLTPAEVPNIQSAIEDIAAGLVTGDAVPVLLHGEESPAAGPFTITSFTVLSQAGTQRRRMRR